MEENKSSGNLSPPPYPGVFEKNISEECTEGCHTKATTYCVSCPGSPTICLECFRLSHGTQVKSTHELKALIMRPRPKSITCVDHHGEALEFYCDDDHVLCCSLCILSGKHQGHKILTVNASATCFRKNLPAFMTDINEELTRLQVQVGDLQETLRKLQFCVDEKSSFTFMKIWAEISALPPLQQLYVKQKKAQDKVPDVSSILCRLDMSRLIAHAKMRKAELIYDGDNHGWKAADFHKKCDNQGPTLTIVEDTDGNVFGAYTSRSWTGAGAYQTDKDAFIFSLKSPTNNKLKIFPVKHFNYHAVHDKSLSGPTFGWCDLSLQANFNLPRGGLTTLGHDYHNDMNNSSYLTGSHQFQVAHLEVFALEN
jgi:hypothetical protein